MHELDSAISDAGGFRWYQVALLLCSLVPLTLVGANMGASVFVAMVPDARCRSPSEEFVMKDCPDDFQTFLVPSVDGEPSLCSRYSYTERNITSMYFPIQTKNNSIICNSSVDVEFPDTVPCEEWAYDNSVMRSTIVTDFNLMCGNSWAGYFAQSALMIGVGLGSMLAGTLSDKLGRRHAFLFSCVGSIVFGIGLAFTQSYLSFCIVRTLLGFFTYSCFPVLFVLNSEMTTPRYRSLSGQIMELGFPFGFIFLSLVSYALREWRKVQIVLVAPYALGILMWWHMPESPRWLYQEGRKEEAFKIIGEMARVNGRQSNKVGIADTAPADETQAVGQHEETEKSDDVGVAFSRPEAESHNIFAAFKFPSIKYACLKLFYIWFCVSCVYYGLTLNAAELGKDPFTNMCLNSLAEVFGDAIAVPLLNVAGRRLTFCGSGILAGVFCMIVVFAPAGALPVAILGKMAISVAFGTTYIYTNEIFPTPIRTSGISICNAMARLGGVVSPLIAMSGLAVVELPYILFGVLAITAGGLVLTLPETKGTGLPQTMEEGEAFIAKNIGIKSLCY